ncbi:MAG: hypothetical protein HY012_06225 [Acidobacteria bacterium]|nr:hypothetical protein [Acidobacteriota bacterium]
MRLSVQYLRLVYETELSFAEYLNLPPKSKIDPSKLPDVSEVTGDGKLVFQRSPQLKGPMSVFGYDYFTDKYGEERGRRLKLLNFQGLRGSGEEYAYEVLNFVDGVRNAQQIRDAVSAEYGPVPLEFVVEYLQALEIIGVIQQVRRGERRK